MKSEGKNKSKIEYSQMPLRMPIVIKKLITRRAAEATIKRGEKVSENTWILEAITEKANNHDQK